MSNIINTLESKLMKKRVRDLTRAELEQEYPEGLPLEKKMFFATDDVKQTLESRAKAVCPNDGRDYPTTTCLDTDIRPEAPVAFTNGRVSHVNVLTKLLNKVVSMWEYYLCLVFLRLHEQGHVLYTDFQESKQISERFLKNCLTDEEKALCPHLAKMMARPDIKKVTLYNLARYWGRLQNSVEDGFVDFTIVLHRCPGQRIAREILYRYDFTKDWWVNNASKRKLHEKFDHLCLSWSRHRVEDFPDSAKDDLAVKAFLRVKEEITEATRDKNPHRRNMAGIILLEEYWKLLEIEAKNEQKQKQQKSNQQQSNQQQSDSQGESGESDSNSDSSDNQSGNSDSNSSDSQENESDSDSNSNSSSSSSTSDSEDEEDGSGASDGPVEESDEESGSSDGSDDSEESDGSNESKGSDEAEGSDESEGSDEAEGSDETEGSKGSGEDEDSESEDSNASGDSTDSEEEDSEDTNESEGKGSSDESEDSHESEEGNDESSEGENQDGKNESEELSEEELENLSTEELEEMLDKSAEEKSEELDADEQERKGHNSTGLASDKADGLDNSEEKSEEEQEKDAKADIETDKNNFDKALKQPMEESQNDRDILDELKRVNAEVKRAGIDRQIKATFEREIPSRESEREREQRISIEKPILDRRVNILAHKCEAVLKELSDESVEHSLYNGQFEAKPIRMMTDGRTFQKKKKPGELPRLAAGVLMDRSGSMKGKREQEAAYAAYVLYETMLRLKFPCFVMGHCAWDKVMLTSFADEKSIKDEGKRILNYKGSSGCNRDGFAIRYVSNKLARLNADIKLLIIVCDGKPSYYDDLTQGVSDCREAIRYAKSLGHIPIVVGLGDEALHVKAVYFDGVKKKDQPFFLDCTKEEMITKTFVKLLNKYVCQENQ